ncbi:C1q-like domain-containing protein [Paenibacillus agri]|uniref:C1q domain-containing protein n=1 Tax=Paenibacillus agri TaxID=2744309 RepID=A0A850ERC6_9BACL|nr:hypothetical protein [Paenibacillus agri]NUU61282.1 hypothetical protein [Paenibacillus agri]
MQTTGNLGLKKPEGTDYVDIADLNGNMDKLDTEVVKLASPTENGRMSAADKAKLNGVAAGANNYVHPNHTGDVTSNGDGVTAIAPGVIVNSDVNAAAGIDASKIGTGVVSNTAFSYLNGVTSGIQGQLNARPLLTTTPQQTTADITYYVRTDGNDNNNGLANTAGGAFRTIGKAVSVIPQTVNHTVTVNVASGTYAEAVLIEGITGKGYVNFVGVPETSIQSFKANRCHRVVVKGFKATSANSIGFTADDSGKVDFDSCVVIASGSREGIVVQGGTTSTISKCTISNRSVAMLANDSTISSIDNNGIGNTTAGLYTNLGAIYTLGTQPAGAVGVNSGIITSGVINPWGDNTWYQRSRAEAGPNGVQTINPATFTKVAFATEYQDILGEYNPATSSFIARATGAYLFSVQIGVTGGIEGTTRGIVELWVNGGAGKVRIFDSTMGAGTDFSAVGAAAISLGAGDYAEVFIWLSTTKLLTTTTEYNFVRILRIA